MVDYGISIMAFLRFCKIGYHWKAFERIVKWPYQITDWNPVCIFQFAIWSNIFAKGFWIWKILISFYKCKCNKILKKSKGENNVWITWITK